MQWVGDGVLIIFLGGGVSPGPENPYPISGQNIRFSIPYFQTWLSKCIPDFRPCDVLQCRQLSIALRHMGLRDALNDVRAYFFFAINVHSNTRYSKNGIPDQTDGI